MVLQYQTTNKKKQKNEIKKKCDTEGSHLETGITLQYHQSKVLAVFLPIKESILLKDVVD